MIKIQTLDRIDNIEHIVVPTIFPDGTSQVWKLPEEIIESLNVKVIWNFEAEREIFDILSLKKLIYKAKNTHLHIPYLPFARQDKYVSNETTFNLHILAECLNQADFTLVTAVDVHNVEFCTEWIHNFKNIKINDLINDIIDGDKVNIIPAQAVIFPDSGAEKRYSNIDGKHFSCQKVRNQSTGEITDLKCDDLDLSMVARILIVDDICDGGATFIRVTKMLKAKNMGSDLYAIDLFVTHGIFSKGKQVLHEAGIKNIYTTNSLLKNTDGFKV